MDSATERRRRRWLRSPNRSADQVRVVLAAARARRRYLRTLALRERIAAQITDRLRRRHLGDMHAVLPDSMFDRLRELNLALEDDLSTIGEARR